MEVFNKFDFSKYVSMKIGACKDMVYQVDSTEDFLQIIEKFENHEIIMLGACTNTVIGENTENRLFVINKIMKREVIEEDETYVIVKFGGGENLDEIIQYTLENGWVGLESLSIIPGTIGAAPVQNAGAYGSEIGDVLTEIYAYDTVTKQCVTLHHDDCAFGYRTSIFNTGLLKRYMILYVTLKLLKANEDTLFAANERRKEVIALRNTKIPDYTVFPSSGSFFRNPFVPLDQAKHIQSLYEDCNCFPCEKEGHVKLSAGWLIKKTYPQGALIYGLRIDPHHPLILINESMRNESDLWAASQIIIRKVYEKFAIELHPEVNMIGIQKTQS